MTPIVYDLLKQPDKRAEMNAKSGQTYVPVLDVYGTIIVGYKADGSTDKEILTALGKA